MGKSKNNHGSHSTLPTYTPTYPGCLYIYLQTWEVRMGMDDLSNGTVVTLLSHQREPCPCVYHVWIAISSERTRQSLHNTIMNQPIL